ncbi:hypothetical protein FNL37_1812 [Methylovorus glucosotrophus]|nr:hypothetical protein FNL37_1812 [Methylovorus glucosotrophus]
MRWVEKGGFRREVYVNEQGKILGRIEYFAAMDYVAAFIYGVGDIGTYIDMPSAKKAVEDYVRNNK